MHYLGLYALVLPVAFVIDMVWIGLVANRFYREQLGDLFATNIVWPAAIIFYLFYIAALLFFAVAPAIEARSFAKALLLGAALGFTAYMTYDLTNLAVIRNWPLLMSVVDIVWGTLMSSAVAGMAYLIATKLLHF